METPDHQLAKPANKGRVLGGEVPLWAEQTDSGNLEPLLWPRAAAWAGASWEDRSAMVTNPRTEKEVKAAFKAHDELRSAMAMLRSELGIDYTALQIMWCTVENGEFCDSYAKPYLLRK
eukprot:Gregarina_sp_Poly_1__4976@NODE_2638_length_1888_cov_12_947831_g1674_i0_p2_GENE_NODE_2638_length_1888_cov_12_947831_g1674_i0NODE_2638_length_1888_cov_12_947831_g1674_i0_p2_ORF_typecomplete_len119_score18_70Glyco_hydro_20/PF00728_22/1_4e07_NODE_2638_length_1888_cov_12_947831_g1674_i014931849